MIQYRVYFENTPHCVLFRSHNDESAIDHVLKTAAGRRVEYLHKQLVPSRWDAVLLPGKISFDS